MSASNTFENDLLKLIFNNDNIASIGDATGLRGSSVAGNLYVALHTADPGEAGSAITSECAYTSYARVAVARSSAGFTVSGSTVTNTAQTQFPKATGGSETATYFSVVNTSSGAGTILVSGALSSSLAISNNIQPTFAAGQLSATAD